LLLSKDEQLSAVLQKYGFDAREAARAIAEVNSSPLFQAGLRVADKLRKLESLLAIYEELSHLTPLAQAVEVRRSISWAEFLCNYYELNQPVILSRIMRNWKATALWDPAYLRNLCGDELVEVMSGRNSDPHYEMNLSSHKKLLPFSQYVDLVLTSGETNDFYMTANNHFFETSAGQKLLEDISVFPEYLDPDRLQGHAFLWFGPAGTVTPLHHDTSNILFAQVHGRKNFTLISPNQTPLVYNEIGVFSEVDCGEPNFDKYPAFQKVHKREVILAPGQVLFIPVGWWHYVRALDVSISVSFTNFKVPNSYHWDNPQGFLRSVAAAPAPNT
jgi:hypothetical protein